MNAQDASGFVDGTSVLHRLNTVCHPILIEIVSSRIREKHSNCGPFISSKPVNHPNKAIRSNIVLDRDSGIGRTA